MSLRRALTRCTPQRLEPLIIWTSICLPRCKGRHSHKPKYKNEIIKSCRVGTYPPLRLQGSDERLAERSSRAANNCTTLLSHRSGLPTIGKSFQLGGKCCGRKSYEAGTVDLNSRFTFTHPKLPSNSQSPRHCRSPGHRRRPPPKTFGLPVTVSNGFSSIGKNANDHPTPSRLWLDNLPWGVTIASDDAEITTKKGDLPPPSP